MTTAHLSVVFECRMSWKHVKRKKDGFVRILGGSLIPHPHQKSVLRKRKNINLNLWSNCVKTVGMFRVKIQLMELWRGGAQHGHRYLTSIKRKDEGKFTLMPLSCPFLSLSPSSPPRGLFAGFWELRPNHLGDGKSVPVRFETLSHADSHPSVYAEVRMSILMENLNL